MNDLNKYLEKISGEKVLKKKVKTKKRSINEGDIYFLDAQIERILIRVKNIENKLGIVNNDDDEFDDDEFDDDYH